MNVYFKIHFFSFYLDHTLASPFQFHPHLNTHDKLVLQLYISICSYMVLLASQGARTRVFLVLAVLYHPSDHPIVNQ